MKHRLTLILVCLLVAAGCSADDPDGETTTSSPTTTQPGAAGSTSTTTTTVPLAAACVGPLPAFPTYLPETDPLDVEGTPGPGPGSPEPAEGQLVSHWIRDFGIVIEMRWPGSVPPQEGLPGAELISGEAFDAYLVLPDPDQAGNRVVATIAVGSDDSDPCSVLTVEAYAPQVDPVYDELYAFVESLQPLADRSAYVAAVLASLSPVAGSERPTGMCAEPIPTGADEFGYPDEAAAQTLVERFLSDRLSGKSAEQCLTVAALQDYQPLELAPPTPGPCLFGCGDLITVTDAELAMVTSTNAQLLVSYRYTDGTELKLRESLALRAVPDADAGYVALIDHVWIGPESWVDDLAGRRVIEDLLDAIAAGEYDLAAAYLVNEGFAQEVEDRLGDLFSEPADRLFAKFCATAACGAPYEIGETVAVDEWSRTYRVVFQTTSGPVSTDFRTGVFEGTVTADALPPDGEAAGQEVRIDRRIFGADYPRPLMIVRDRSVERIVAGRADWSLMWRARWLDRFEVAGGNIIESRLEDMGGGVYRLALGAEAADLIAAPPFTLVGTSTAANRGVVFVAGNDSLDVVDLATMSQTTLRDFSGLDETPYAVDGANGTNRLLLTMGAGESTWFEIYEFDETALTLGDLITRIDPDGALGFGHLAPDGQTIATTYDDSFYDPVQTVALLDATNGRVLGRWTIAAPNTITTLDYDGRWIVAELSEGGLFVVDTASADVRKVDTTVRVRFG